MIPSEYTLELPKLGIAVSMVRSNEGFDQALEQMFAAGSRGHYFIALNPEKIMRASYDRDLLEALRNADMNFVDGIGILIAGRLLAGIRLQRVWAGAKILDFVNKQGGSVYILGSKEETNQKAQAALRDTYSNLKKVGGHHGFDPNSNEIVREIQNFQPDVLLVGLGTPKQEKWIFANRNETNARFVMGVGGMIDYLAGEVRRAPIVFQKLGLEWFYRLACQPSRVRRQIALPRFVAAVLRQKFS